MPSAPLINGAQPCCHEPREPVTHVVEGRDGPVEPVRVMNEVAQAGRTGTLGQRSDQPCVGPREGAAGVSCPIRLVLWHDLSAFPLAHQDVVAKAPKFVKAEPMAPAAV